MKLRNPLQRSEIIALAASGQLDALAEVSKETRENSKTLKGEGSFPINKCTGEGPSVESAIAAVGRGSKGDPAKGNEIRRHIISAAKDLGCSEQIPDTWNEDGSLNEESKAADGDAFAPAVPVRESKKVEETKEEEPEDAKLVKCPNCGNETPADGKFCAYCGKALPMTAAGPPAPGEPASPPEEEGGEGEKLNEPPELIPDDDDAIGAAFTIPVGIIEGQETGDGRKIAPGALDWRTPPLPLMLLATSTHDPMGMSANDPAVLCGRIDTLERKPGEGDTQIISAKGNFLNDENGSYAAELVEQMGRLGVSGDVAVEETDIAVTDVDDIGMPMDLDETLSKGTLMAFTVCPMPAFEGAYIVLGDGAEQPEPIPQASEPEVTAAAPIHFMTYADCGCQEGMEVITAAGGPARPPKAWFEDPQFELGDGRLVEIHGSRGETKHACPLTVTEDGRVFGHIAPWEVCHTGRPGCITAPSSPSGYAMFMRGYVLTAEGEKVRTGTITADVGHAPTSGISSIGAMAHYDNSALEVADVAAGEDEYGIWVAGALRPNANEAQVRKLTAGSISGDWRRFSGNDLDLVAALAVPLPGFPVAAVKDGERVAMVASGARVMQAAKSPGTLKEGMPESTIRALERIAARDARERMAALG